MNTPMRRRTLLRGGMVSLGLSLFPRGVVCAAEPPPPVLELPRLRLYTWAGYFKPELVSSFAVDQTCEVQVSTFASNEEMLVNLEAEKDRYDLITPSVYTLGTLRRSGQISALDAARLPNRKFVEKEHLTSAADPRGEWSVPFAVSVSGLGYMEGKNQPRLFSWGALDETESFRKFTLLDDMREVLGAALKSLGKSVNSKNAADIAAAKEVAGRWMKSARKLQSEGYRDNLTAGVDRLAHGYGGDFLHQSGASGVAQFFIPEEGAATTWDHFCVPAHSKNKALAHEFVNFFCLPHVAAQNMEWSGFRSAIREARGLLPAAFREHPTLYPLPELQAKCEALDDLGDALPLYERAWNSLLAG